MNIKDLVRILPETMNKLLQQAALSVKRCETLSLGFCSLGLVEALQDYFCGITDRMGKILQQIRVETDVDDIERPSDILANEDGVYERRSSAGHDDYEIGRNEMGRHEWGHFQMGLISLFFEFIYFL